MQTGFYRLPVKATRPVLVLAACCATNAVAQQDLMPTRASDQRALLDNPLSAWGRDYTNWVEFSFGRNFVDGNKATFQRRMQIPAGDFGGIEAFHWETPTIKDWLLEIDGRSIFGNNDYDLRLNWVNPKVGFIRGGFREYRVWYDQHGGFFPPASTWITPFDEEGHIDRGEFWVQGGLTLPNMPRFTFGYSHQTRRGTKDSTTWGDAGLLTASRKIVPSLWDIQEKSDVFRLDMEHTLGKTDFALGLRYELGGLSNTRKIVRQPGNPVADRRVTHDEDEGSDIFNVHGSTETPITERVLFTTGAAFTSMHTEFTGSRIYGSDFDAIYDPVFARRQPFDEGFLDLNGSTTLRQYLANINLQVTPWENLTIVPGIRVEKYDNSGVSHFGETNFEPAPGAPAAFEELQVYDNNSFLDVSENVEARYTGLRNWSFYARGEWLQGDGTIQEQEIDAETRATALTRKTDSDRFTQKYTVGANWYATQRLSVGAQYYHKIRDNNYDHSEDSTPNDLTSGDRYPAFLETQKFDQDDVNFRITLRPLAHLTLISRYDFQMADVDTGVPFLGEIESAEMQSHIFGETITWSPINRLYLQGSLNYVFDHMTTPAEDLTEGVVQDFHNDYWNVSGLVGINLDPKTDLQFQYYYYRADNYEDNSTIGMPYGASGEEHGVTATLMRQLTRAMRWSLKYGFFTNHEKTYGGNTDYNAHLVYTSIQYRF